MTSGSPELGSISSSDISRLNQIEDDGVAQLNNPSEIRLRKFTGTGASLAINFSSDRMSELIQDFVNKARAEKISVVCAGEDYPLHATISDGKYAKPKDKEQVSDEIIELIKSGQDMRKVQSLLSGLKISFDRLVIAPGGAILFAATEYPNAVRQIRAKMDYIYPANGLEKKPTDDILFSTAVRLSTDNSSISPEQAQKYLDLFRDLQSKVTRDPIEITTTQPYFGPSANLIPK